MDRRLSFMGRSNTGESKIATFPNTKPLSIIYKKLTTGGKDGLFEGTVAGSDTIKEVAQKFAASWRNFLPNERYDSMYAGYLEGIHEPAALKLAIDFFYDTPGHELNTQSYNAFNQRCYELFLAKQIPGRVVYDQPSYEDVKAYLIATGAGVRVDWSNRTAAHHPNENLKELRKRSAPGLEGTRNKKARVD